MPISDNTTNLPQSQLLFPLYVANSDWKKFGHYTVLLQETIEGLNIRPTGAYIDCTCGAGGDAFEIARRLDFAAGGRLVCLDRDEEALEITKRRLAEFSGVIYVKANYTEAADKLARLGIEKIDGFVMDLGVSSMQLDTPERGFSYSDSAVLDMRMDSDSSLTAEQVVNTYSAERLTQVIFQFGEERYAPQIARAVVREREREPITDTVRLAEIIKAAIPAQSRSGGHHPAKRMFQAIRCEVNGEITSIRPTIESLVPMLNPGGRAAVISFHSLEDRQVKQTFADFARGCVCPPEFPVCICGHSPVLKPITKKFTGPSALELSESPRSRSAKLRVAQKI